jgi:alcohol dehydrogenase class IV
MKINELIQTFEVWTTNEEKELLKKLSSPTKLSALSEQEQFRVQAMIRKSLVTRIGMVNPSVVSNDQYK